MTNKLIGVALFAVLLTLAPLAAAEADSGNTTGGAEERPDDAAWMEDCPPDMMCAYSDEPKENTTRGPEDCDFCRSEGDSGDNTTWGTDCPRGVHCMVDGETDDPDDAGWVDCDGEICAYGDGPADSGPVAEGDAATGETSLSGTYAFVGAIAVMGLAFVSSIRRD